MPDVSALGTDLGFFELLVFRPYQFFIGGFGTSTRIALIVFRAVASQERWQNGTNAVV